MYFREEKYKRLTVIYISASVWISDFEFARKWTRNTCEHGRSIIFGLRMRNNGPNLA
jgi:hypothetical protein